MNGGVVVVHRAVRGAVVGPEGGDVKVEGSGNLDVNEGVGW